MSLNKTVFLKVTVPVILGLLGFFVLIMLIVFGNLDFNSKSSASQDSTVIKQKQHVEDSLNTLKEIATHETYPKINYTHFNIKTAKDLYKLLWKFRKTDSSSVAYRALTTLNRKELRFFRVGQTVLVPDSVSSDLKAYSLFPQYYPGAVNLPKLIMVSNRFMCYGCYEHGKLVRFAACNPGKEKTPSYPGRYALAWKERNHRSSIDSSWVMPYTFNFHTEAGSAFHQFDMPGYPASHSCIRQFMEDAEWLYSWGRGIQRDSNKKFVPMSGTPVVIIDHYDFNKDKGRLWTKLNSNKDSLLKLPMNPMAVDEALIPMCQIPEVSRGKLRNKSRYVMAEDSLRRAGVIRAGVKLTETVDFNKLKRQKAAKAYKLKMLKEQEFQKMEPAKR